MAIYGSSRLKINTDFGHIVVVSPMIEIVRLKHQAAKTNTHFEISTLLGHHLVPSDAIASIVHPLTDSTNLSIRI